MYTGKLDGYSISKSPVLVHPKSETILEVYKKKICFYVYPGKGHSIAQVLMNNFFYIVLGWKKITEHREKNIIKAFNLFKQKHENDIVDLVWIENDGLVPAHWELSKFLEEDLLGIMRENKLNA